MPTPLSRRKFIGRTVAAGAGLSLALSSPAAETAEPAKSGKRAARKSTGPWPRWDERDEAALLDVLRSGKWGRGLGERVKEFEAAFREKMRAKHCIATSSGTTALLTAMGALEVGPGDEVILPPYTFVATFNSITANFALPVFVDCDIDSFQIDASKVAAAITPRTKLLLPVHIGGTPADLDALTATAKARKVTLLEDACQAPLAEWRGQPVGTHGIGGCFSFQASKNLTSGEGGAILTNDDNFANLCFNYHTPGHAKPGPESGRGANYRLTEFQAALLLAQMTRLDVQAKTRDENAAYLTELLQKIPGIHPAKLPTGTTRSAYHLYMLRYDKQHFAGLSRAKFLQALAKEGVGGSSGYTPLNNSAHVKSLANNAHFQRIYGKETMARWVERNQCPVNDRICEEAIWFSQHSLLGTRSDMERKAEIIAGIRRRSGDIAKA